MQMKKLFGALLLCAALGSMSAPAFAQTATASATAAVKDPVDSLVKFKKETIDFGTTKQNNPVSVDYVFTNISDHPVLIQNAQASCGCTTPSWTKEPVLPGKEGKVTATYNASGMGKQNKTIWIRFKGMNQDKELHLLGTVVSK